MSKLVVSITVVIGILIVSYFLFFAGKGTSIEELEDNVEQFEEMVETVETNTNWRDVEIIDLLSGEKYIISEISKPILLESFAVWCPTCKKQQDEIKVLHEELGDSFISISLDTDPNEDLNQVISHANRYRYNWIFAISPKEMTKNLIDEFGVGIVNAPGAPVVLICNGEAKLLSRGVKSANTLKERIEAC